MRICATEIFLGRQVTSYDHTLRLRGFLETFTRRGTAVDDLGRSQPSATD